MEREAAEKLSPIEQRNTTLEVLDLDNGHCCGIGGGRRKLATWGGGDAATRKRRLSE
jgi:hypothetical protein